MGPLPKDGRLGVMYIQSDIRSVEPPVPSHRVAWLAETGQFRYFSMNHRAKYGDMQYSSYAI